MIHSLSGGTLSDGEIYTFAKVRANGSVLWCLAPMKVETGDRVLILLEREETEGEVERVEHCTRQTAPVPMRAAREILSVLPKNT